MEIVLNATPLIYLTKIGFFRHLERLSITLMTSEEVMAEVLSGDFPEQAEIKKLMDEKKLAVKKVKILDEFAVEELDKGEASVLTLAKEKNTILLSDDKAAIGVGKIKDVEVLHSTFLIFRAIGKKAITKKQAAGHLDELIEAGWYCDIQTYLRIRRVIEDY